MLEVQPAAVLAGVLDDEPAQEAGGRAVGEREARQLAQQRRVAARGAEAPRRRDIPVCDAPHRAAVDDDGDEDQRLLLRRVLQPAARGARHEASERTSSGLAAVVPRRVGAQAAGASPSSTRRLIASACSRIAGRRPSPRQRHRAVDVGARHRLAPRQAAERQPGERRRRLAGVRDRELDQPPDERVDDHGVDRRRCAAAPSARGAARRSSGAARAPPATSSSRRRRAGDRRAQVKRRPRLGGDEVGVLDDAEHPAGRRDDGEVADAAIEHVQPHLAAQPVGRHRVGRRRHRLARRARRADSPPATTRVRRSRSVRIPSDAAEVDDDARGARVGHPLRRVADRWSAAGRRSAACARARRRAGARGRVAAARLARRARGARGPAASARRTAAPRAGRAARGRRRPGCGSRRCPARRAR